MGFRVANRSAERGEDAGAAVSHEQVKSGAQRYPVDRYLVESSNKIEMVTIAGDEIWNSEPAIRPEDEVVLRKLHEMLQSTADDLKLISGELTKCREPRKQMKTTPLDEEFNEKVHIEEIVNAKFHGYQIEPAQDRIKYSQNDNCIKTPVKPRPKSINASVQVNQISNRQKAPTTKNLTTSRTRLLQIDEKPQLKNNNKAKYKAPLVTYNEYAYKYDEPEPKIQQEKPFNIQTMPSINIRGELKHQKVLQLDIIPDKKADSENVPTRTNVAVIAMQHEPTTTIERPSKYPEVTYMSNTSKPAVRKVSTMLTCDSSESSSHLPYKTNLKSRNLNKSHDRSPPKSSAPTKTKLSEIHNKAKTEKPFKSNIDEWRKKINTIYGGPSTSKKSRVKSTAKVSTKSESVSTRSNDKPKSKLNNAEYIPYSKLTLGGVNVSDIEREISDLTDKNVPLSSILDKILVSRENSFHESASKRDNTNKNILTTSDENLLEEVLDIERDITTTLNKNLKRMDNTISDISSGSNRSGKSYADDFEEERSDNEKTSEENNTNQSKVQKEENVTELKQTGIEDTTYTKSPKLNFKNTVDVFEFIHSIDRQDNATQSNCSRKTSLKSTQTSPRNVQPIRNDLWTEPSKTSTMKSSSDVEKILNEDFIKKLIVDECAAILQKNLSKPTTSKETNGKKNFAASQKKTQTSPAHVKSVMTSPTRTKTRMTSPLALSLTVDHQTSPIDLPTNEDNLHIELDKIEDLAISINLSSPRFSLRLPRDSREVLSNIDGTLKSDRKEYKPLPIKYFPSSSSADADYSSDISSLGEINEKLRRKPRRSKYPSISESASSISKYSSDLSSVVLPLKSEGEISLGQVVRKNKLSRSDGEMSLGRR